MIFHNIIEVILGDKIKIRALKTLRKFPDGVSGRELGRIIKTSHFKANSILQDLVSQHVIIAKKVGTAIIYKLNEEHFFVNLIESLFNNAENIFDIIGEKLFFKLEPRPLSIILHGSVVRGEERPTSDIDVLVIYDDAVFEEKLIDSMLLAGSEFPSEFGNTLSAIAVPLSRFKSGVKEKGSLFYNVFKEGRVIAGLSISEVLSYVGSEIKDN